MKTWTDGNGRTWTSQQVRPFVVVTGMRTRWYGSLDAARKAAPPGSRIFFETSRGTGPYVQHI